MPSNDTIIRGTAGNDNLRGTAGNDVFDANAGGDDILSGLDGDDTYWLGLDTGHDVIKESGGADIIKIKAGIGFVRLVRSADSKDLIVQTLHRRRMTNASRSRAWSVTTVSNSLTVKGYYGSSVKRVEKLQFANGTEWGEDEFIAAPIAGANRIGHGLGYGTSIGRIYDINISYVRARGGVEDWISMGGESNVYWFGIGTGYDTITRRGGTNNTVKIKSGIGTDSVKLSRLGSHLIINIVDSVGKETDSMTVIDYYSDRKSALTRVEFADGGTVWDEDDFGAANRPGLRDNVYWLGRGSGHDIVRDNGGNDTIKLKAGIGTDSVRLVRTSVWGGRNPSEDWSGVTHHADLIVQILDSDGDVTDSLRFAHHWTSDSRLEKLVFADGTEWGAAEFKLARLMGSSDHEDALDGTLGADVFDSSAGGNDWLRGYGGRDVYWLGRGTEYDIISERDSDSVIKLKSGKGVDSARMMWTQRWDTWGRKKYDELDVQLLNADGGSTDSLRMLLHNSSLTPNMLESLEFSDGVKLLNVRDVVGSFTGGSEYRFAYGGAVADVFDIAGGKDEALYGRGGNDSYILGAGTGHDLIKEHVGNTAKGDAADVIKLKAAVGINSMRFLRNGEDLLVELLSADGKATADSLTVEDYYANANAKVEKLQLSDGVELLDVDDIAGDFTAGNSRIVSYGDGEKADVFAGTNGADDVLYGRGGNDVYAFGIGSGRDRINEHVGNTATGDAGDVIKLKAAAVGVVNLVRLSRNDDDFLVELLDAKEKVTDSLTVDDYYVKASAKVEKLQFSNGAELLDVDDIAESFTAGSDYRFAYGGAAVDVFDIDGGKDESLYGRSGNDSYMLGAGTGHDLIKEHVGNNATRDAADEINLKAGIGTGDVRLVRSYDRQDLLVELLNESGDVTDSLTVEEYYKNKSAKVENVKFVDGTVWDEDHLDNVGITRPAPGVGGLRGSAGNDSFNGRYGGNDKLYGKGGHDVYWLGRRTDSDVIVESEGNSLVGDDGDVIRVRGGIGPDSVRLSRTKNGKHLDVELLDDDGEVSDKLRVRDYYTKANAKVERVEFADGTVWGAKEFLQAEIMGGSEDDKLYGLSAISGVFDGADVFDGDAGGSDTLHGRGGDDVYWLGRGTGFDVIMESEGNTLEGDAGDVIKVKEGIGPDSVRLSRTAKGKHLDVELLDGDGNVSDRLRVRDYYTNANAKVERVEFADGTVWGVKEFSQVEIIGSSGNDNLYGVSGISDVFDGDAGGSDNLHGRGGDDVYLLGRGTGNDRIKEYEGNTALGDGGDVIRLKEGFAPSSLELSREGNNLVVSLGGSGQDSLTVENHFSSAAAKVERIETGGNVLLEKDYQRLIDALSDFSSGDAVFDSKADIYNYYWDSGTTLSTSGGG